MGQTIDILPKVKKAYAFFFHSRKIKAIAKRIVSYIVDAYARERKFYFPEKFSWDWKLEMLNGKYESETVSEFKKIIEPGMIVLDIGAHIGYFTDLFSKLAGTTGTVYAFEADKENYGILEKNMENRSNVRIYNRAVTDHVGEIDFYRTVDKSGSHSTVSSDARPEKVSVRAETLDNFVRKNYIKHIDVIKMDIEGGEPAALKGMRQVLTQNHKLQMVMEFSPVNLREAGTDPADVLQILNGYGFSVKAIRQEGNYFVTADSIPEIERMRNGYVNVLLFKARHED